MKKNLVKTIVIGALTLTLISGLSSKKIMSTYESESNTLNLKSGYKMTLFNDNTPDEEEKKTNNVESPKTGIEDYAPYALGGILILGLIVLYNKKKTKVYKI